MLCIFLRGVGIVGEGLTQPDRTLDHKDHGRDSDTETDIVHIVSWTERDRTNM